MAEKPNIHKLGKLASLARSCKTIRATNDPEVFHIVVSERTTTKEIRDLDTGEVSIEKVIDPDGKSQNFHEEHLIDSGATIEIRVPRRAKSLFVAKELDDLLQFEDARTAEPNEYLIFDLQNPKNTFWSADPSPIKNNLFEIINSYKSTVELICLLLREADVTSHNPLQATFFDVDKVEIHISFRLEDLDGVIPVSDLETFLNEPSVGGARREAFRGTLWDKLKHFGPDERLPRLIKASRFGQFLRTVKHNFIIEQRDHRLDRRLEAARSEQRSIAEDVGKLVLSLETKALVIPGTLVIAARFLEPGKGFVLGNNILIASTAVLSLILYFGYTSQKQIIDSLESDIAAAKDMLSDTEDESAMNIKFDSLSQRLKIVAISKLVLFVTSAILSVGAFLSAVL